MLVIIDGDPMVYRAGFAAEEHHYELVVEMPDGEMAQVVFAPLPANGKDRKEPITAGDQMKAFIKEHECTVLQKDKVIIPYPEEHALQAVKTAITNCVEAVAKKYGIVSSDMDVIVLLSGPGNFREELATIKPYKGNRDDMIKPHWYQSIRNYMTENWDAQVIHGREADDECSILATNARLDGKPAIICTIDKDLDQVPGMHYDYMKHVFYDVDPEEGKLFFWAQVLAGDATDNIQGLYRVGVKKALSLIENWQGVIDDLPDEGRLMTDDEAMWYRIVLEYQQNMEKYPDKHPEGMTPEEAAIENARLVFMQEYEGQLWTPPGVPDEIVEYL